MTEVVSECNEYDILSSDRDQSNILDMNKRNFYLTLFNIYSQLPFEECLTSFAKIYNDVFV